MCSFCEERPSAGAVTLWFDRSSCEICGPCMKRYCWAHGKAPLKNGFICHLCCTARWCANENCDQFFRAPISQKYCEKCVDSAEACLVGDFCLDDETDNEEESDSEDIVTSDFSSIEDDEEMDLISAISELM